MIDAVMHTISRCGESNNVHISLWTWTVALHDVEQASILYRSRKIASGTLGQSQNVIAEWKVAFGPNSVRYVSNHAKMARVWVPGGVRYLLRGSMNLNCNPRFEQFDITEGGADFELIERIESELPILPDSCTDGEAIAASNVSESWRARKEIAIFGDLKIWRQ